jgi:hypothetical protein
MNAVEIELAISEFAEQAVDRPEFAGFAPDGFASVQAAIDFLQPVAFDHLGRGPCKALWQRRASLGCETPRKVMKT